MVLVNECYSFVIDAPGSIPNTRKEGEVGGVGWRRGQPTTAYAGRRRPRSARLRRQPGGGSAAAPPEQQWPWRAAPGLAPGKQTLFVLVCCCCVAVVCLGLGSA